MITFNRQGWLRASFVAGVCVLAVSAPFASADLAGKMFRIEVSDAYGSGFWELNLKGGIVRSDGVGVSTESYQWALSREISICDRQDPSREIAKILPDGTGVQYVDDPQVNLNFAVQAGAADTTFTIASALLSFPTINSPQGRASASYSASDTNFNGVTLTGLGGNTSKAFVTQYNGWAALNLGTSFAEVIASMSAGPFGTAIANVDVPPVGTLPIGIPVYDMSTLIKFRLTRGDLASGTTTYVITPEPSSLLLLALGGLVLRRR